MFKKFYHSYDYPENDNKKLLQEDVKRSGYVTIILTLMSFMILYITIDMRLWKANYMLSASLITGLSVLTMWSVYHCKDTMYSVASYKQTLRLIDFNCLAFLAYLSYDAPNTLVVAFYVLLLTLHYTLVLRRNPIKDVMLIILVTFYLLCVMCANGCTLWSLALLLLLVICLLVADFGLYYNYTLMYEINKSLLNGSDYLQHELDKTTVALMSTLDTKANIQDSIIYAIADLIENRDADTGEHVKRTAFYVTTLTNRCIEMGYYVDELTEKFIDMLRKAAPMHDIGKIAIPDSVLQAPRRLTSAEFEVMKQHCVAGSNIIIKVFGDVESEDYVSCASKVAQYHHEKWNGSGYPFGLSGCDIPLEARIMAIADVFDALVSKRSYKDEYPLPVAFDIIANESGQHFDPMLVEAFVSCKDHIMVSLVNNTY